MEKINLENEMTFERKFIPNVDLTYDLYEKKTAPMPSLFTQETKQNDAFGAFIEKVFADNAFSSVFSVKSTDDFFGSVPDFYNPLRKVSAHLETRSDSIEVPSALKVVSGINNTETANANIEKVELIRMFATFAKTEWPITFLNKVQANQSYFKSLLGMRVAAVERAMFINGDGNTQPLGIVNALRSVGELAINPTAACADALLGYTMQLDVQYRVNACFMMSSTTYSRLSQIKDKQDRYIFDGKKLFGYEVHVMDELAGSILFGNFKHGYLICDMQNSAQVRTHDLFDRPGSIGLTYSSSCGAGVIDKNAIKLITTK